MEEQIVNLDFSHETACIHCPDYFLNTKQTVASVSVSVSVDLALRDFRCTCAENYRVSNQNLFISYWKDATNVEKHLIRVILQIDCHCCIFSSYRFFWSPLSIDWFPNSSLSYDKHKTKDFSAASSPLLLYVMKFFFFFPTTYLVASLNYIVKFKKNNCICKNNIQNLYSDHGHTESYNGLGWKEP